MDKIHKAIKYIYPTVKTLIDYEVELTAGGEIVIHWGVLTPLTDAEIDQYAAAYDLEQSQDQTALQTIRQTAQNTVGRSITDAFNAAELKALLFVVIHEIGGLRRGVIKPFKDWGQK